MLEHFLFMDWHLNIDHFRGRNYVPISLICICYMYYVLSCLCIFHVIFFSPYQEEIKKSSSKMFEIRQITEEAPLLKVITVACIIISEHKNKTIKKSSH